MWIFMNPRRNVFTIAGSFLISGSDIDSQYNGHEYWKQQFFARQDHKRNARTEKRASSAFHGEKGVSLRGLMMD